jgi:hypothetical protein
MDFRGLFATADEVLRLSPEDSASACCRFSSNCPARAVLIQELQARIASDTPNAFPLTQYPPSRREEVRRAVMRAWNWLRGEGLVVETPPGVGGFLWRVSEDAVALAGASDSIAAVRNGRVQVLSRPGAIISELAVKSEHLGLIRCSETSRGRC